MHCRGGAGRPPALAEMSSVRGSRTGTNQEAVRRHNLGTMLRHVHCVGSTSRAALTAAMGLNRSTIAGLASELEALGLVTGAALDGPRRAGRPSVGLQIARQGPVALAVEVGVDRLVVAVVGLGGRIEATVREQLGENHSPHVVAQRIGELVPHVLGRNAVVTGVGMSVPGLVRAEDGLVRLAPNLGWKDVPFAQLVEDELGWPVSLGNDGDLGALAEHVRGAGIDVDHLVYVSGDVGVGAGVITSGRPLDGAGGFAGEVGHMTYRHGGYPCHCGNRGCWETEIGAAAIGRSLGLTASQLPRLDEILESGEISLEPLDEIAHHVGRGLVNLVNLLNPDVIVLGGYLGSLHSIYGNTIDEIVRQSSLAAIGACVTVTRSPLGGNSLILGAAELVFEPMFADPVQACDPLHSAG